MNGWALMVKQFAKESGKMEYELTQIVDAINKVLERCKAAMSENDMDLCQQFLSEIKYNDGSGSQSFNKLKKIFKNTGCKATFILGAGVSNDFGVPNWEELVFRVNFSKYWQNMYSGKGKDFDKLLVEAPKLFDKNPNECSPHMTHLKDMFRLNSSLYEWAQYAENNFRMEEASKEERLLFERPNHISDRTLDNVLYSVVGESLYYKGKYPPDVTNYTLYKICKIINKKEIGHIITYNYDDCFEACCEKAKLECLPVFDKQQILELPTDDKRCIAYHVHGFIPHFSEYKFDVEGYKAGKKFGSIKDAYESDDGKKLILTEVSYDDIQGKIYQWRNSIQVDTLLRYSCFFVGFSATDVNFKRIVKQLSEINGNKVNGSEHEIPEHFIAICIDDYISKYFYSDDISKNELKKIAQNGSGAVTQFIRKCKYPKYYNSLYPYIMSSLYMLMDRCNYLKRFNIHPLITTIKDLPKLLSQL